MLIVSKNDIQHISITELDAVLKGVNVVLQWKPTELHLLMDSTYVHGWISDTLSGKARINKGLQQDATLVNKYNLPMSITLVKHNQN